MKAISIQKGEMIDYIPAADTAAGEVIVQGKLIGITTEPIKAGKLGAIRVCGVFGITKKASETFAVGDVVYWDNGATATAGDNILGLAVAAAEATDERVQVLLNACAVAVTEGSEESETE